VKNLRKSKAPAEAEVTLFMQQCAKNFRHLTASVNDDARNNF